MRIRSVLTGLILLFFGLMNANAQGFHIGAKAGTNINKINGRSFTDQAEYGLSAGGFVEIDFAKKWGLQPELLWNQSKTTTASDIGSVYPEGLVNQDITLNYLSIPILLTYRPVPVLSLQAGPQFGILLSQTQNFVYNVEDAFKKGDFSLVGGAQVNLGGFLIGARYYIGLTNLNDISSEDKWTNQGIQAYIGFRIF
jgi:hypothetical protein